MSSVSTLRGKAKSMRPVATVKSDAEDHQALLSISDDLFSNAPNEAFRARAISEYKRVAHWVGNKINWNTARILDFGCGQGIAAASFAMRFPGAHVVGADLEEVNVEYLDTHLRQQVNQPAPANVEFVTTSELERQRPFDLIYSWSVFEHVREDQMVDVFKLLKNLMAPGGVMFVQVNPLYFSPRGSHLYRYFKGNWHHLLMPLSELREGVFAKGVSETQTREWRQFLELNRLTARDILGRAATAGLIRKREALLKSDIVPPARLTRVYDPDVLVTSELMALFE